VKVLDFGCAHQDARIQGGPTASGIVLGTPSYLPPEQAQGKPSLVDHRSDLFAWAPLMFRAAQRPARARRRSATEN
jgi:serine/threonine protein kinase